MFKRLHVLRTLDTAKTRAFLALVFVVAGLLPAPAAAIPVLTPIKMTMTVTAVGAGETVAEAVSNAVSNLQKDYFVLSYSVVDTLCTYIDPIGPPEPVPFCSAEIEAHVLRKFVIVRP